MPSSAGWPSSATTSRTPPSAGPGNSSCSWPTARKTSSTKTWRISCAAPSRWPQRPLPLWGRAGWGPRSDGDRSAAPARRCTAADQGGLRRLRLLPGENRSLRGGEREYRDTCAELRDGLLRGHPWLLECRAERDLPAQAGRALSALPQVDGATQDQARRVGRAALRADPRGCPP